VTSRSFLASTASGTLTGPLTINTTSAAGTIPIGPTGAVQTGLAVQSSYAGGDDDGSGTDSTGRINLYSYQRANTRSFGETIRNFAMRSDAKTMQAFYMPVQTSTRKGGYSASTRDPMTSGVSWKPVAWQGAHYEANDHGSIHGHWELEVADSTGALQGRLEVPFIDQAVDGAHAIDQAMIGVDWTNIRTNLADFSVRAQSITSGAYSGTNTALRVGGNNSVNKDLHLSISSDMGTAGRRWVLRANTTTEAGSNAGTDFQLLRYDDTGAQLGTAIGVERSTGNILIGATPPGAQARLHIVPPTTKHGVSVVPTSSQGSNGAYDAQLTLAGDRAYQTTVAGDANRRMVIYADGKHEWGDGTAGRDTNLYRSAADTLTTDDSLTVGGNLTVTGIGKTIFARKSADESVTSSNTLQDDDHLTVAVVANAVYEIEGFLIYDGSTTGDIKIAWTVPSGATLTWSAPGPPSSASGNTSSVKLAKENTSGDFYGAIGTGAGNSLVLAIRGILRTSSTAGSLTLQWAQNTADATATTVYTDSYIKASRVA
jgi:hypothetical protein